MKRQTLHCLIVATLAGAWTAAAGPAAHAADAKASIDFIRQVRPILSDNCFSCHGPDQKKRKAKLRLDQRDSILAKRDKGVVVVVPGDPAKSEMIRKITAADPDDRMPPADSGKKLTPEQIEVLRHWIEQGAPWQGHWAFLAPQKPPVPKASDPTWPVNEVDHFILATMQQHGLSPSPPADKATLIRRVTMDLTGLPPTPEELDAFLADNSPDAYERLVDRLLQSPRYGEHMARYWLDAARYGDTHGLHLDNYREMWPYRDWVINAFNQNMPFDQFTTEQLAGDLLPNPTLDQLIATGFNRCNVTTNEGGSISQEVYVRNVIDRVDTTGTVFLGMTIGCARCHDHKYDPITQKDFYSMFAFFNSIDGQPMDGNSAQHAPIIRVITDEQKQQAAAKRKEADALDQRIAAELAKVNYVEPPAPSTPPPAAPAQHTDLVWIDDDTPAGAKLQGNSPWQWVSDHVNTGARASKRTAGGLSQHFFDGAKQPLVVGKDDKLFAYIYIDPKNPPREIMLQWNSTGWLHRAYWGENVIDWGADKSPQRRVMGPLPEAGKWVRLEVDAAHVGLNPGATIQGWAFTQFDGTVWWDTAGIKTKTPQQVVKPQDKSLVRWAQQQRALPKPELPAPVLAAVKAQPDKRSEQQSKLLRDYFLTYVYADTRPVFTPLIQKKSQIEDQAKKLEESGPTTLVWKELAKPRPSYVLYRGEYDKQRDEVQRHTPAFMPPMPDGAPMDRLGLARWLLDRSHPLTARVTVNRFWQQVFGVGIVKTAEDFGVQGQPPSHPELLDWLAVQFMDDGWDVKRFMKRLVMSAAYRQSSKVTADRLAKDPDNRLLSRGPRFRLDAEMLRDQALAVSGLLMNKMGGPSVKPPQPDGLWFAVGYSGSNTVRFRQDKGADKIYRRTVYTFIKRTSPPPQMSTFDAPSREACTVRRERTNTPLQALLLLNDPQYVEAARAFAQRAMKQGGTTPEQRAAFMFRLATSRQPRPQELAEIVGAYQDHLSHFKSEPDAGKKLIEVGESKPDPALDPADLAAWTMVANLILNLDEVITKS